MIKDPYILLLKRGGRVIRVDEYENIYDVEIEYPYRYVAPDLTTKWVTEVVTLAPREE